MDLRTFLDTYGCRLVQNEDLLPFFAFPYLEDEKIHSNYEILSSTEWKNDLLDRLDAFLDKLPEKEVDPRHAFCLSNTNSSKPLSNDGSAYEHQNNDNNIVQSSMLCKESHSECESFHEPNVIEENIDWNNLSSRKEKDSNAMDLEHLSIKDSLIVDLFPSFGLKREIQDGDDASVLHWLRRWRLKLSTDAQEERESDIQKIEKGDLLNLKTSRTAIEVYLK